MSFDPTEGGSRLQDLGPGGSIAEFSDFGRKALETAPKAPS